MLCGEGKGGMQSAKAQVPTNNASKGRSAKRKKSKTIPRPSTRRRVKGGSFGDQLNKNHEVPTQPSIEARGEKKEN